MAKKHSGRHRRSGRYEVRDQRVSGRLNRIMDRQGSQLLELVRDHFEEIPEKSRINIIEASQKAMMSDFEDTSDSARKNGNRALAYLETLEKLTSGTTELPTRSARLPLVLYQETESGWSNGELDGYEWDNFYETVLTQALKGIDAYQIDLTFFNIGDLSGSKIPTKRMSFKKSAPVTFSQQNSSNLVGHIRRIVNATSGRYEIVHIEARYTSPEDKEEKRVYVNAYTLLPFAYVTTRDEKKLPLDPALTISKKLQNLRHDDETRQVQIGEYLVSNRG